MSIKIGFNYRGQSVFTLFNELYQLGRQLGLFVRGIKQKLRSLFPHHLVKHGFMKKPLHFGSDLNRSPCVTVIGWSGLSSSF